jgi:hypothetical protein
MAPLAIADWAPITNQPTKTRLVSPPTKAPWNTNTILPENDRSKCLSAMTTGNPKVSDPSTEVRHWTRSWASSLHPPSSQQVCLRSISTFKVFLCVCPHLRLYLGVSPRKEHAKREEPQHGAVCHTADCNGDLQVETGDQWLLQEGLGHTPWVTKMLNAPKYGRIAVVLLEVGLSVLYRVKRVHSEML